MTALFFDTTNSIKLGLLDKELSWISYEGHPSKKASQAIHGLIHDLLQQNKIDIKNLDCIFKIAGPGSYTGMRVSEGMSQIFEWSDFKTYSFYHYDIAQIENPDDGIWAAKAFKNEIFIFEWEKESHKTEIMSLEKARDYLSKTQKKIYSYDKESLEELGINSSSTTELLEAHSQRILSVVKSFKDPRPLFYFRSIEEEFSRGK